MPQYYEYTLDNGLQGIASLKELCRMYRAGVRFSAFRMDAKKEDIYFSLLVLNPRFFNNARHIPMPEVDGSLALKY